jgi:hypothetical protein
LSKITDEVVMGVYMTVGQLAVNWSLLEFSMDTVIATIFHEAGGKDVEKKLPLHLADKLSFLKRSLELPALARYSARGRELLDDVERLKDTRHHIIHGYFSAYSEAGHIITFVRLSLEEDKRMHIVHERGYTAVQLLARGKEAGDIAHRFKNFCLELIKEFDPESAAIRILDDKETLR